MGNNENGALKMTLSIGALFLILEVKIWIIILKKKTKMKIQMMMKTCNDSCGEASEQSEISKKEDKGQKLLQ
jgi:predicted double-glycine peptidase